MPDFYAHQVFGTLVWDALPQTLQNRLMPERPGWNCGVYGPDPLFFYSLRQGNPVCREGHLLHSCSPEDFLERCRDAAGSLPYAVGYAAGFLTHYVLDSACHPIVNTYARGSTCRHTLLEGAFDRSLTPAGESGLPGKAPADAAVYAAAAAGFCHVGPEGYARSLNRFLLVSRVTAVFRHLTPRRTPWRKVTGQLAEAMEMQVPVAAALTARLVEALDTGGPLDFLPTLDFSGQETVGGPVCKTI